MKREHWIQLGLAASSMVLLTGCYQRYQRQSSPKKEVATSQTSAKKQAKKADNKQLYQSVFSDYQKIFATSKDLDAISKLNDELAKEDRMINSWVIETVINQPEAVRYAFKDLNNDGVDEMIIANQQTDGSYFVTGVYYLKDQKPTLACTKVSSLVTEERAMRQPSIREEKSWKSAGCRVLVEV